MNHTERERKRRKQVELKDKSSNKNNDNRKIRIESCDSVIVWYNKTSPVKYLSEIIMIYSFHARV